MKRFVVSFLCLCHLLGVSASGSEGPTPWTTLIHQGKTAEAIALLKGAIEKDDDPALHLMLGYALFRHGDLERAESVLKRSRKESGLRPGLQLLLAQIAYRQGELTEALAEIELGMTNDPNDRELRDLRDKITKELPVEKEMANNFSGNFIVTFEGGEERLGAETVSALERSYVELGSLFECWPEAKTVVILYPNRDFKAVTGAPDWSGGLYDGKIRVPIGGIDRMTPRLRAVLNHEYAHVLIKKLAGSKVPLWLNEGLAQWSEHQQPLPRSPQLHKVVAAQKTLPFSRLERNLDGLTGDEVALAYEQSASLVAFMIDRWGWSAIPPILRRIGAGETFDTAAHDHLEPWGGTLGGMVAEWEDSLQTKP